MHWETPTPARLGQRSEGSDEEPEGPGARALSPALQGLVALVIYLAVFIVGFGRSLVGGLDVPRVGQDVTDPNFYIWAMGWWPYALSHGLNPLYSHAIGAPAGYNLAAWASSTPSLAVLMWPVTAAFGPITSFNVALLLAPPSAAWAAFVAARRLTGRFWAALMAGAVYGFNVNEVNRDTRGWLNVTVSLLFPVLVYLVLLWWDGTLGRTGFVIWMALALALEFYTFTEAFFEMTLVILAALVTGFAVAGRAARRTVSRLAGLIAIAYAGAGLLASPYLLDELLHLPAGLIRNTWGFSLRLPDLVSKKSTVYVGTPLLVLLLMFAVLTWSSKVTRLLVVTFAAIIALGVGPVLVVGRKQVFTLPWSGLWSLPVARDAEGNRFIVFGYLVLAIVLALWLAAPVRSRLLLTARWGLAVLALAAIFADLPTFANVVVPPPPTLQAAVPALRPTNTLPAFLTDHLYRRYLKPGETVVVISDRVNAGDLFQADADFYFRIAGGFINISLNNVSALPAPVTQLADPTPARERAFLGYVRAAGVGAVIVERAWESKWMRVFGRLGMRSTTVGGVTLYRVSSGHGAGLPVREAAGQP